MRPIEDRIAEAIGAHSHQVHAAIDLLDGGATVPFIARYRKEATGGLDDQQLRVLEERLRYLRELEDRRATILASIEEQGQLSASLRTAILEAETKSRLEDLYLPYKPRRRTRAQIAREAGLEPLADALLSDPTRNPEVEAAGYVDAERGVADPSAALDGARAILIERFSEIPGLVGELRDWLWDHGRVRARLIDGKAKAGAKFADYFDFAEAIATLPSHRTLALFRARNEGIVELELQPLKPGVARRGGPTRPGEDEAAQLAEGHAHAAGRVAHWANVADAGRAADRWLLEACRLAWKAKLHLHLTLDLFGRLREQAEDEAIRVFGANLQDLLLAAPAGPRVVIGLDPGLRTGVKVAVVDATGKLLETTTLYPHAPQRQWDQGIGTLAELARRHGARLVAIGNGTASRETEHWVAELQSRHPQLGLQRVVVSEAGASVYSASEIAAREFPELDVALRGAVSIARRLQDPLAELVKIEPKAIGVGQYQHDVNQVKLGRSLDARVEDCVNAVGVDLNTASAPLLARVAGLGPGLAEAIVRYRDQHGPFRNRRQLLDVPRLGPKAFEQCAGFLRIRDGDEPLDASAVHPEAYPVVARISAACGRPVGQLIGDRAFLRTIRPQDYADERFGLPTVRDILAELEKPGRDPRPAFRTVRYAEGVNTLADLKPGMVLEGVVSNVANFGAFVDIGVHQDGLVHVSALADRYVKDPREVVKAGDIVKVRVVEVDAARKRIALSMRLEPAPTARPARRNARPEAAAALPTGGPRRPMQPRAGRESKPTPVGALGAALADAIKRKR